MIFTTSINTNYLPKARTLAQSIKKHHPDSKFVLCLVERERIDLSQFPEFDEVVIPKDVWPSEHDKILYKYDVVEACTAVKGELFCYLLEKKTAENVFIYLDPDIQVLSPLTELVKSLDTNEIVLTPHLTEPETTIDAILDNEISVARHGVFNLGFLGIKRGQNSLRFTRWWADRLKAFSYADYYNGLFTDQKWVDQAPAFFDVFILKHPGYNVAPWNIGKREVSFSNDNFYVKDNIPLRFFHFSGLDSGANLVMIKKYAGQSNAIFKLRDGYTKLLNMNGEDPSARTPWSYDVDNTNSKLLKKAKRTYQRHFGINDPYNNVPAVRSLALVIKKRLSKSIKALLKD